MSNLSLNVSPLASRISRRGFVASSALMILGAGACSRSDSDMSSETAVRSQFTFLPSLPPTSLAFAPELLADAAGYFADQNLDVIFEETRGSSQAAQLVLAGKGQLTRLTQIEGMRAAANQDVPLVNVGMLLKRSTIRFISSIEKPLRTPNDFIGKTIGISSKGGGTELELDLYLAAGGVDRANVNRQVVGLTPGVFDLVERGRIAGFAVALDTSKVLKQQKPNSVVVLDPGELISSGQFYMASRNGLTQDREAIIKFMNGVRAALKFIINDDGFEKTLAILRSKYSFSSLDDTSIAKQSLAEYMNAWTIGGSDKVLLTDASSWSKGYKELVDAGLAAPDKVPERWFTNDFVKDAP